MNSYPNINYCWSTLMIEELIRNGVDHYYIAPGSRSSALAIAAARHPKAHVTVHFDERGLAFMAMGHVAATHKPVALICTSGTAVANFFPAIIEASKKKLPLMVLTADRPPELRQTGAVQTIDQVNIYGKYACWQADLPCPTFDIHPEYVLTTIDQAVFAATSQAGVVHLNCMFREPLHPLKIKANWGAYLKSIKSWVTSGRPYTTYISGPRTISQDNLKEVAQRISNIKQGLIVVGKISPTDTHHCIALAKKLGWPILADVSSSLRLGINAKEIVHYYHRILEAKDPYIKGVDGIIHLGGRMTSKRYYEFIRDQQLREYVMLLNHSLRSDPVHKVTCRIVGPIGQVVHDLTGIIPKRKQSATCVGLIKHNARLSQRLDLQGKTQGNLNEGLCARLVSELIPKDTGLFLSNSMPVRDMDMSASADGAWVYVNGNRGASGIDGIIASAAGYARGLKQPVTLMIGDLAALYDLNSLALLKEVAHPLIIVVINNGGGGIFSHLPVAKEKDVFDQLFRTPHAYTFSNAAAMFELNYAQVDDLDQLGKVYSNAFKSNTSTIIDVIIRTVSR